MEDPTVKQEMEGPEAAYVQSDLYADVMQPPQQQDIIIPQQQQQQPPEQKAGNGQYVQPQVSRPGVMEYRSYTTIHPKSVEQQEKESKIAQTVDNHPRGKQLYVGNLTWWTNDEEVTNCIQECGVTDFISIKFFENRINGQSKGFALVEVGSETSQRLCMERLPNQMLHNQKPIVTFVNKQSLTMFENQARKDMPGLASEDQNQRKPYREPKPKPQQYQAPHIVQGFPPPGANIVSAPMMDPNLMQQQALHMPQGGFPPGSIIMDAMGNIIQGGVPGMNMQGPPPGLPPNSMGGPMQHLQTRQGVAPHINPAFIQDGAPPIDPMTGAPLQTAGLNEQDMESMRRNQAVASTAIQRAMTDANAGEFESGIETLVTAISLIQQSTTANTDPAKVLVQSLQDCLQGLEGQLVQRGPPGGGGGHHRGGRYGNDYRNDKQDRRRRRDRSRSRSRSRDKRRSYSPQQPQQQQRSRSRERRRR